MIAAQILAPVVMISTCAIMLNGLIIHYNSLGERARVMHRERLSLLSQNDDYAHELNHIINDLLKHHHQVHDVLILLYLSISVFIFDMLVIALELSNPLPWLNQLVTIIFLLGLGILLYSVVLISIELGTSHESLQLEAHRNCSLCKKINKSTI